MSDVTASLSCVSSFVGASAKAVCEGNAHAVIHIPPRAEAEGHLDEHTLRCIARLCAPLITVFLWSAKKGGAHRMRAFQLAGQPLQHPGDSQLGSAVREIDRCGSAALAAAKILSDASPQRIFRVHSKAGPISVGKAGQDYYYQTPFLPCQPTDLCMPWAKVVNRKIQHIALIGGPGQYCLALFKREQDVAQLRLNTQLLCRTSKRALIVTAPSHAPGVDYVMRYFSPQYSRKEDAATGSANAMLAAYWQAKFKRCSVRGKQCSAEGALFTVKRIGMEQGVFGACQRGDVPAQVAAKIGEYLRLIQ